MDPVRLTRALPHALMALAMVPCVVGGAPAAHAAAALLMFALAVGHARRARRNTAGLPAVVDALAMAVLSVAAAMCGHAAQIGGAAASGHSHGGVQTVGTASVLVVLAVAGWLALRLSCAPRGGGMSRRIASVMSIGMVTGMAAMTLVHAL